MDLHVSLFCGEYAVPFIAAWTHSAVYIVCSNKTKKKEKKAAFPQYIFQGTLEPT